MAHKPGRVHLRKELQLKTHLLTQVQTQKQEQVQLVSCNTASDILSTAWLLVLLEGRKKGVSLSSCGSGSAGGKPMKSFSMACFNSESPKIWASDAPLEPTSAQMNL